MMGDNGDAFTPWKLPRPNIEAICSTGKLSKKQRHDVRHSLPLESSPCTPSKSAKSKFLMPVNITPFPFSPQNLMSAQQTNTPRPELSALLSSHKSLKVSDRNSSPLGSKALIDGGIDLMEMSDFDDSSSDDLIYAVDLISSEAAYVSCPWKCPSFQNLDHKYFTGAYPNICCRECTHTEYVTDYLHDNYNVLEFVGRGSFSEVYRVESKKDGKVYALKKSTSPYTGISDRYALILYLIFRIKKIEEVKTLWRLKGHANIISIESAWEQSGILYILTEFCGTGR